MGMYTYFGDYEMKWSGLLAEAGRSACIEAKTGFITVKRNQIFSLIVFLADRIDREKISPYVREVGLTQKVLRLSRAINDLSVLISYNNSAHMEGDLNFG